MEGKALGEILRHLLVWLGTLSHLTVAMAAGCDRPPKAPALDRLDTGGPRNHVGSAIGAPPSATARRARPLANVAGMNASRYRPTNRSTSLAVSPDGSKVAVSWLHNEDSSGAFAITGEPTTYATIGDPADPGSFTVPHVVGERIFDYVGTHNSDYNRNHNAPFALANPSGGFLILSVPMNANGWAQAMAPTGYGYHESRTQPGSTAWSTPGLAGLRQVSLGSSLSEASGGFDGDDNLHLFGQAQLGSANGGMAYQRRTRGDTLIDTVTLGAAYRPSGMYYFGEGQGFVSPTRNAAGKFDLHVAFAWNAEGGAPMYGLYYLESADGGYTWTDAAGQAVTLPVLGTSDVAAVVPANLGSGAYSGSIPGVRGISMATSRSGVPVIVRPQYDSTRGNRQAIVYAHAGGRWVSVPVGRMMYFDQGGTGVAINEVTGRVNVVLLDPGSASVPGRVLLYHMPLSGLVAGSTAWTEEVVASVPNGSSYASSLQVAAVPNKRFVVMLEPNYTNPGWVKPVLLEAPMH